MMFKHIKKIISLCLVTTTVLAMSSITVFAASPTNPSTSASITSSKAKASMSIGIGNSANLEIMYLLQQVKKTDATVVREPQSFSYAKGNKLSDTKYPESGYTLVRGRFNFYVNNVKYDLLYRYV